MPFHFLAGLILLALAGNHSMGADAVLAALGLFGLAAIFRRRFSGREMTMV